MAAWLGRSPYYADALEWPEGIDDTSVAIGGDPIENNADVAWVHYTVQSRKAVGCLSLNRRGKIPTQSAVGTASVYFVGEESDRLLFWRDAIIVEGDNAATLQRMAVHAYPQIYFFRVFWETLIASTADT